MGGVIPSQDAWKRVSSVVKEVEGKRGTDKPPAARPPRVAGRYEFEPVVVRTRDFNSESELLTVTPVWCEETEDGSERLVLKNDESREIWTWFGLTAKHYANIAWLGSDDVEGWQRRILKAWFVLGRWRVEQEVRWAFPLKDAKYRVAGCFPVVM